MIMSVIFGLRVNVYSIVQLEKIQCSRFELFALQSCALNANKGCVCTQFDRILIRSYCFEQNYSAIHLSDLTRSSVKREKSVSDEARYLEAILGRIKMCIISQTVIS